MTISTARFPPRGIAAAAYATNMPLACLLTLRRRENTLRGASVAGTAIWGPRRSPAKRVRWGEEAQRSERRLPLCGGRRDTELVPTTRRAQRNFFGGKGVSLFRQLSAPPPEAAPGHAGPPPAGRTAQRGTGTAAGPAGAGGRRRCRGPAAPAPGCCRLS